MVAMMMLMMVATVATLAMVVMVVFCQQRWWSRRQWWERSSTAGMYILYVIYHKYIICYIYYVIAHCVRHGRGTVDARIVKADIPVQVRCALAQMLFKKQKIVKMIFPEWDRSPHQQAPCHHGLHHLGASGRIQAGRYFKCIKYFEEL